MLLTLRPSSQTQIVLLNSRPTLPSVIQLYTGYITLEDPQASQIQHAYTWVHSLSHPLLATSSAVTQTRTLGVITGFSFSFNFHFLPCYMSTEFWKLYLSKPLIHTPTTLSCNSHIFLEFFLQPLNEFSCLLSCHLQTHSPHKYPSDLSKMKLW